ncbi:MAG: biopolymer transporter ExbD [Planctomycetota bacterium]
MLLQTAEENTGVSIDFTPIIDMVFNLLIFFLVATTFHQTEREMRIALPVAKSDLPMSTLLRELVINVDAEGHAIVSGQVMELDALQEHVTGAVQKNPEQKATIRGDRNTAYSNVVRVLDICKSAGIQEPYLDTVLGP